MSTSRLGSTHLGSVGIGLGTFLLCGYWTRVWAVQDLDPIQEAIILAKAEKVPLKIVPWLLTSWPFMTATPCKSVDFVLLGNRHLGQPASLSSSSCLLN